MDRTAHSAVPAKRAPSPGTAFTPQSSAQKRTRTAGSKNLKQHEWALVHQHLLRRNRENKDTVFVIHGIKHDWHNVHRRILRAVSRGQEPIQESMSLPELPSYVELRSPSPAPAPSLPNVIINAGLDLESPVQQRDESFSSSTPRSSHTVSDGQSDKLISRNTLRVPLMVYNANLATIPCSEIFDEFRGLDWNGYGSHKSISFKLDSFGRVTAYTEDSLGTFVDRLYASLYPRPLKSHLEILFSFVHDGRVSISYLLETIVRRGNGRVMEILKEFALEFYISEVGTRALGTAAFLNNFEAVDMLLGEHVDVNTSIFSPHFTPNCDCQIGVVAYAQLPRFDGEQSGANDEMIAHLLSRGAANVADDNTWLLGLLSCVLKETAIDEDILLFKVQAVVERIDGLPDAVCETESVLETCLVEWWLKDDCGESRLQVFEYLLAQGAKASPGSPLAVLIYRGLPEELFWDLLETTENINAYSNSLTRNSHFESVSLIHGPLDAKKSINPLQAAALTANETIIHILLQKGADVNCPARGFCGVTPLQGVCRFEAKSPRDRRKKTRIVKLLLENGANVNAAPAWNRGLTALQTAAFVGDVEIADLLVSSGANVNAPACQFGGGTALVVATRRGHPDMARFLLRKRALIPDRGTVLCFGRVFEFYSEIWNLLQISALDLPGMSGGIGNYPPDYQEYEAEWADDATYKKN